MRDSILSDEYDDSSHETCRLFDECSSRALHFLDERYKPDVAIRRILEIGVGGGRSLGLLSGYLEKKGFSGLKIDILDISSKMLAITREKHKDVVGRSIHCSVHAEGDDWANCVGAIKYDFIMANMCDPYLTDRALSNVSHLLSPKGVLFLSYPTADWAQKKRGTLKDVTVFRDKRGEKYLSFSFCPTKDELLEMLSRVGLHSVLDGVVAIAEVNKDAVEYNYFLTVHGDAK